MSKEGSLEYQVERLESIIEGYFLGIKMAGSTPNSVQTIIDATREIITLVSKHERKQNIKAIMSDKSDIKDMGDKTLEVRHYDERTRDSARTHFAQLLKKRT